MGRTAAQHPRDTAGWNVPKKEKAGSPPPFMSVKCRQYIRGGDNG